jgi:putative transposase
MQGYDYSQNGSYYITICTFARNLFFGDVNLECDSDKRKGVPYRINEKGRIIEAEWLSLQTRFPGIALDRYSVMPDHFHGIIIISRNHAGMAENLRAEQRPATTVGDIICAFKSITTKACNSVDSVQGRRIWQRDYFERVIRNTQEMEGYRKYIGNNPSDWKKGEHYLFSTEVVGPEM